MNCGDLLSVVNKLQTQVTQSLSMSAASKIQ